MLSTEENLKKRQSLVYWVEFPSENFILKWPSCSEIPFNGTQYNMEVLHGIQKKHLEMIEECDKMLMTKLFNCPEGTPTEAFFLETSALPFRFILFGRRIMYYWTLLHKLKNELASEVFEAQKLFKSKDSWIVQVEDDM